MKKGILIVSFGTTFRETREKNIHKIAEEVRALYPEALVCEAFSSDKVRKVLKERDGIDIPDTYQALEEMKRQGVTHVTVLPTHIIDGIENEKMKQGVVAAGSFFEEIKTADVLLAAEEDYPLAAKALWDSIRQTAGGYPVILMGHGTVHEADASYPKFEQAVRAYSKSPVFLATVEGAVMLEDAIARLKQEVPEHTKVFLFPFMLVAGDHAHNDMAGKEDSFFSRLSEEGYEPECVLKGIGEYEAVRKIYLKHLQEA